MYEGLVKSLRWLGFMFPETHPAHDDADRMSNNIHLHCTQAADAIEELTAKINSLQFFVDNISKLPDCNTCLKKDMCEFMPKYGEYCRINCPAWLGVPEPPKEETC